MHGHRIYQWTPYLAMDPVFSHVVHCTPYLGIDPAFSLWLVFSFPSRSLSPLGALHAPRAHLLSFVPLAPNPSVHTSAKRNKSFGNAHPTLPSNALLGTRTPGERAPERAPVLVHHELLKAPLYTPRTTKKHTCYIHHELFKNALKSKTVVGIGPRATRTTPSSRRVSRPRTSSH